MLLELHALEFAYGGRPAVQGVEFAIREGEIFGLLGPNGAGKTTTIHCICGLLAGWTGSMRFRGEDFVPAARGSDRARLGVVPQEIALYDDLSGAENLRFFGQVAGLTGAAVETAVRRALGLSGLEDRAGDRVATYSGGMKRRLNIAVSDLHQPELLLLDEPTVGVDPQSRNHIFESLLELKNTGRTLLYTTHYIEEAERLCDRVAVINDGRIIALGTAEALAVEAGVPGANLEAVFLKLTGRSLRD